MPRIEKQVIVLNKNGLCIRASAAFVDVTKKFKSVVTVVKGEDRVNGRSIMALWILGARHQTPLLLIVEG
ncbi:MAG: HPr family phosphocarrier protein, partial [Candidatus Omnitrophota bacterium]|nr:HPr family phosphocarrier protein [Candidatus Omnitrophota bacterium]